MKKGTKDLIRRTLEEMARYKTTREMFEERLIGILSCLLHEEKISWKTYKKYEKIMLNIIDEKKVSLKMRTQYI